MRRALVLVLDASGLGLLVAAAWTTWGLGAGLTALGLALLGLALVIERAR
ncbi:MAG TPA: hypothetical protein VNO79_02695 [Actinomycetota bacterium]|nr:hypothetical protein [Actinomycetota bacterium]